MSLHALNIHTHTQHTHTYTLCGCHISLYLVAWCELWLCHCMGGLWVCVFVVCISDPLFACLFIKQPLTPNQCCPECLRMCVNDKMIYRNIPKIKPTRYCSLNGPCGEHAINVYSCILKHIGQVYAHKLRGLFGGQRGQSAGETAPQIYSL